MSEHTQVTEDAPDHVHVETRLKIMGDWKADPLTLLTSLREGARSLDKWQRRAAQAARERGSSWEEIGTACGVSRQAAWERFGGSE